MSGSKRQGGGAGAGGGVERNQHRQVDNELRSYLQHVKQLLDKNEFEDEEERQILINNVFSELRHKEVNIATHSGVTRTLEGFLPLFSPYKLRAFLHHMREKYVRLGTDCAGSHILEKVIGLFAKYLGDEDADADEKVDDADEDDQTAETEQIPGCEEVLLGVCKEFADEWGNLAMDSYGTHVVRTLVRVLAGLPPTESNNDQSKQEAQDPKPSKKLKKKTMEVIELILKQLQDDKHKAQEIIYHRYACPTIQTLLVALDKLDKHRMGELISDLLMLNSSDAQASRKHMDKALRHPIASHFVEKALQLCSPEVYMKLYADYFRHHVVDYGTDPSANYVIQQLISSARHHAQPKLILDELLEDPKSVVSLFKSGKGGIVVKLIEALNKFPEIQKKDKKRLCTSIRSAFHMTADDNQSAAEKSADDKKDFDIKALLQVKTSMRDDMANKKKKKKKSGKKSSFSPIGCRLAQSLMVYPFDCVDFLLNSFLGLDKDYLLSMGLDTAASRVVEAYLDDSCQAPTKHKLKVIRAMQGIYAKLAVDPCGSHIVEKCYKAADVQVKGLIAEELMLDEKKLDAEKYGKAVLIKCKIGQYKMKKEAWTEKATSIDKKKKMFEDILNDQDDDLLPSSTKQQATEHDGDHETGKAIKSTKIRGVAFVEDKFGSAALREELHRAQRKEKAKTPTKQKPLDAVESQMMELLGYAGKTDKKRMRDESSEDEDSSEDEEETTNKHKGTRNTDASLGYIMDVIAATKSTRRAETPKQKAEARSKKTTQGKPAKKPRKDTTA